MSQEVTQVRLTNFISASVYGLEPGNVYDIDTEREMHVKDANGLEVWIFSELKGVWIWLSSIEYEPIKATSK